MKGVAKLVGVELLWFVGGCLFGLVLWVAVALTYISGAQYLLDGRGAATTLGHRTAST